MNNQSPIEVSTLESLLSVSDSTKVMGYDQSDIYIGFAMNSTEYNNGYPARMSDENTMYTGDGANWQIQSNQYKRVLLCFTSSTYTTAYGYRGYVME